MRSLLPFVMVSVIVAMVSCGENAPPRPGSGQLPGATLFTPGTRTADSTAPPQDAQWTIHCATISGPVHVERARRLKEDMLQATDMRDWYVVHGEQESTLYYGHYKSVDPQDAASRQAQAELKHILAYRDARGGSPFRLCVFVEINSGDPPAPPEWNLLNKDRHLADDDPRRAYWSLEIMAFVDHPRRKEAAVQAVKDFRAQNPPVEAYYYHGPAISGVYIGAWPRDAIARQEQAAAHTSAADADRPIVVFDRPMSKEAIEKMNLPANAKILMPRVEIRDPTLLAAMSQYSAHYVNYEQAIKKIRDPLTGMEERIADESFIVEIPRPQKTLLSRPATGDAVTSPSVVTPPTTVHPPIDPTPPGMGGLRGIDP